MTDQIVCDASAVVAMLLDDGKSGRAAARVLGAAHLAGPALVVFEVANIIRRTELAGLIGADQAAQAHADLLDLPIEVWPYDAVAGRTGASARPHQLRRRLRRAGRAARGAPRHPRCADRAGPRAPLPRGRALTTAAGLQR